MSKKNDSRGRAVSKPAVGVAERDRLAVHRHVEIEARGRLDAMTIEDIVQRALEAIVRRSPQNPLAYAKRAASNMVSDAVASLGRSVPSSGAHERETGSAEDAFLAADRREPILEQCRARFMIATGVRWTDELAERVRREIAPKESIERHARAIFDDLRAVLRRADAFVAAHGRRWKEESEAYVDQFVRERDALDAEMLAKADAEISDEEHAEQLAAGDLLAFFREARRQGLRQPATPTYGPPRPVPTPHEWGPATDLLRSFMLGLGPLPEAIMANSNPFGPMAETPRERLIERLLNGWVPWGEPAVTTAEEIAPITILLDLCEWPALEASSTPKQAIRHEAKLIRGALNRRHGKLTTVIQVDLEKSTNKVVQIPRHRPVRAKNGSVRVQSEAPETDKGACTTQHASPLSPRRTTPRGHRRR